MCLSQAHARAFTRLVGSQNTAMHARMCAASHIQRAQTEIYAKYMQEEHRQKFQLTVCSDRSNSEIAS